MGFQKEKEKHCSMSAEESFDWKLRNISFPISFIGTRSCVSIKSVFKMNVSYLLKGHGGKD